MLTKPRVSVIVSLWGCSSLERLTPDRGYGALVTERSYLHQVVAMLAFVAFASVATIQAFFYWTTARIDTKEADKTVQTTEIYFLGLKEQTGALLADYANWDLAHELVAADDKQGFEEAAAISFEEDPEAMAYNEVFVLNKNREALWTFSPFTDLEWPPYYGLADFDGLIDALEPKEPGVPVWTAHAYIETPRGIAMAGAAFIAEESFDYTTYEPRPVLIFIEDITNFDLEVFAERTGVQDVSISDQPAGGIHVSLPLNTIEGETLRYLSWIPTKPGSELRAEMWLKVLLICLSIAGVCALTM